MNNVIWFCRGFSLSPFPTSALDFITAQPDTEGRVTVTVTNGADEIALEFTADEVAILAGRLADALEIAEEMAR